MKQYKVTLTGLTPLLMHADNLAAMEKINRWRKDPANKELSINGDDRSPAWTWLAYTYHDGNVLGMPSDNLMTMLREGGAKVKSHGRETYKKQTQSGIVIDGEQFDLHVDGITIPVASLRALEGETEFHRHMELAEGYGFELLVKRAKMQRGPKHVRVRPMFRTWELHGSLTVVDEELSGLTQPVLDTILRQAGALVGLGDWRPSSGQSGSFGRFAPTIELM